VLYYTKIKIYLDLNTSFDKMYDCKGILEKSGKLIVRNLVKYNK
jgi:hypothetical protein